MDCNISDALENDKVNDNKNIPKRDLREWQLLEYGIMKTTVDICEKHNLQYYLCAGTLLGAVRHNGFIPWDDDIDIEMPVEDYRKFCKIAPAELQEMGLFLQTHHTEPEYNAMWARVRADGTTSMPISMKNWNIHWGATIDVFPMIGIYGNKFLKRIQYYLFDINVDLLSIDASIALGDKLSKRRKFFKHIPRKIRHILVDINNLYIDRDFRKEKHGAEKWWKIHPIHESEDFLQYKKLLFEDRLFNVPENYDNELRISYGDYMTPPPENERGGHELSQGESIFDAHNDYHMYL